MSIIIDLIETAMSKEFNAPKMAVLLIIRKLSKKGITITPDARDILTISFSDQSNRDDYHGRLEIPDEWIAQYIAEDDREKLSGLEFNADDYVHLHDLYNRTLKHITNVAIEEVTDLAYEEWKAQAEKALSLERTQAQLFNAHITEVWGNALEKLQMIIGISVAEGDSFNREYRPKAAASQDYVFEALTRLHARGMQVGRAVLALLQNGFADDAHARWRTLHELAVTATFIREHGNVVAEAYLLHSIIREYKELFFDQKSYKMMGYAPPSKRYKKDSTINIIC